MKGDADKVLVYNTVFVGKCLEVISNDTDPKNAKKNLDALINDCDWSPNYKSHFLGNLITLDNSQVSDLNLYLKSLRKEIVNRLLYMLFDGPWGTLDLKFWLGFSKRKFMGYDMIAKK